jgi:hypothetical protein
MKRTVQMAKRKMPTPKEETEQSRYPWHNQRPTLGAAVRIVRSLVSIGGIRAACKWTKKKARMARRARGL